MNWACVRSAAVVDGAHAVGRGEPGHQPGVPHHAVPGWARGVQAGPDDPHDAAAGAAATWAMASR